MIINPIAGGGAGSDVNLYNIITVTNSTIAGDSKARLFATDSTLNFELSLPVPKTITKIPFFINVVYTSFDEVTWDDLSSLVTSASHDDHVMMQLSMGPTDESGEYYWYMVTGLNPTWETFSNSRGTAQKDYPGSAYPKLLTASTYDNNYVTINVSGIGNTSYGTMTLPKDALNIQAAAYMYFY